MINQLKRHPRSYGSVRFRPSEQEREKGRERRGERVGQTRFSLSLSLALRVEYGEDLGIRLLIRIALEPNKVSVFNKARTTVFSCPTDWKLNLNIQIKVTFNLSNSVLSEQTREECYIS